MFEKKNNPKNANLLIMYPWLKSSQKILVTHRIMLKLFGMTQKILHHLSLSFLSKFVTFPQRVYSKNNTKYVVMSSPSQL